MALKRRDEKAIKANTAVQQARNVETREANTHHYMNENVELTVALRMRN
jgi:hypothetical protein